MFTIYTRKVVLAACFAFVAADTVPEDVADADAEALRVSLLQRRSQAPAAKAAEEAGGVARLRERRAELQVELREAEALILKLEREGICEDKSQYCDVWARSGECDHNPGWMHDNCAKSCNTCENGADGSGCKDNDANCGAWAGMGECQHNAGWMHDNCMKSCGMCNEVTPPPTAPLDPLVCTNWPNNNPSLTFRERCLFGNSLSDGYEYVYNEGRGTPSAACGKDATCWCCRRKEAPMPVDGLTWHSIPNQVAVDEGQDLGEIAGSSLENCERECDKLGQCHSFTVCEGAGGRKCHLKTAELDGKHNSAYNQYCTSFFKSVGSYFPSDPSLKEPSGGKLMQFYMYRVQGEPPDYPLDSVNTGTLGGIMWYLHNECIFTCDGGGYLSNGGKWGDRKFGITRIRRFKVSVRATAPLIRKGINFGVLKAFDSGECTGPHQGHSKWGEGTGPLGSEEWKKLGYNVGCGYVGFFPHSDWTSGFKYPNAIWYSLPGSCPIHNYKNKPASCTREHPGGHCEVEPTGQGNCTYQVQDAGEINIDELVGIKDGWGNRANFCSKCHTEGSNHGNGGCGLHFWDDMWDKNKNKERVQKALNKFHEQYPTMPKEHELDTPPCDVNPYALGFTDQQNEKQSDMYRPW